MKNKKSRSRTRVYAMEVLYQRKHNDVTVEDILNRYENKYAVDYDYLKELVLGSLAKKNEIDDLIKPQLSNRSVEEISQIEYAILSISVYELISQYDVPYKVVINEALNLTKKYGAQDAYKFVNTVLDKVAKEVRGLECQGD